MRIGLHLWALHAARICLGVCAAAWHVPNASLPVTGHNLVDHTRHGKSIKLCIIPALVEQYSAPARDKRVSAGCAHKKLHGPRASAGGVWMSKQMFPRPLEYAGQHRHRQACRPSACIYPTPSLRNAHV